MDFATVNGLTLHYDLDGAGNGRTPLVFINSLGTDIRSWHGVALRLGVDNNILRHDKRGHGLSDCPPGPYSIHDHATDLKELLDHLGISRAALVGISVGGMIAMDFAATWPERVEKLVLCDTAPIIGTAEMWDARISTIRVYGMDSIANTILGRWFAPSFAERIPAAYRGYYNMLTRIPAAGYVATCQAIRDADLTAAAQTIGAPTLVLCGAEDVSTPPKLVRGLLDLIPNAIYAEIPDAGHLPCIEQPDIMATLIDNFL